MEKSSEPCLGNSTFQMTAIIIIFSSMCLVYLKSNLCLQSSFFPFLNVDSHRFSKFIDFLATIFSWLKNWSFYEKATKMTTSIPEMKHRKEIASGGRAERVDIIKSVSRQP